MKKPLILFSILFIAVHFLNAQTILRGKIIDSESKEAVMNAAVGIPSQGIGVRTSKSGSFLYRKYDQVLKNEDALIITAEGYKSLEIDANQLRELRSSFSTYTLEKMSIDKIDSNDHQMASLYWDVSLAMQNRNTMQEINLLKSFLREKKVKTLAVTVFSNGVVSSKNFDNVLSSFDAVENYLKDVNYDGISNYNDISNNVGDFTIISTNGNSILGTPLIYSDKKVYVLNSVPMKSNNKWLKDLTVYTSGVILGNEEINGSLTRVSGKALKGKVIGPNGPLQEVTINIKGSFEEFKTKGDGTFSVPAQEGDILNFSYLGMYPQALKIENSTDPIAIEMVSKNELLDEVLVSGKSKSKIEKETIYTAFGEETKDQIGYSVNNITADQITPSMIYLADIVRGRFAGVRVLGFGEQATFTIRTGDITFGNSENPTGPIWVVDNIINTETPNWLPTQDIQTMSILKSASATNRYGSIAIGGAFVITTKRNGGDTTQNFRDPRVKGNDYTENIQVLTSTTNEVPVAYRTIASSKSIDEQFDYYNLQLNKKSDDLEFLVDSALYFSKKDSEKGNKVLEDLTYLGRNNIKVLRLVAYLHENNEQSKKALEVYERILKLDPSLSQSYRDLAKAHKEAGEYNAALEMYINILGDQIKGVDFSGLENTLRRELRHLITTQKDKIDFERLPNEWLDPSFKIDMRIVLEWSDPEIPFEFQFVNPKKKYFNWSHTLEENKERLFEEQKQGFITEEFIIDDAQNGDWLINVRYLGQPGDYVLPPFLKYTVYKNYGTAQETKETKIIKLYEQTDKVTVGKIRV